MMKKLQRLQGFTLIEMLLVLAIAASFLVLMINYGTQKADQMRRDKVALQTQQILSAALSYYVNQGAWPSCTTPPCNFNTPTANNLQTTNNVPQIVIKNPWGQPYIYTPSNTANLATGTFFLYTNVMTVPIAQTTVGQLPMGFITNAAGIATNPPTQPAVCQSGGALTGCTYVVSQITIPGENLNNARSVNFAGLYHNGACVPAPTCPGTMSPKIFVSPVSVAGAYYAGGANPSVYPINSFTAYAKGGAGGAPVAAASLPSCDTGTNAAQPACPAGGGLYWRACIDVYTTMGGPVGTAPNNAGQGQNETVMAITRCQPSGEPSGSTIDVYTGTP